MKFSAVLSACTPDEKYSKFIPLFIKQWKTLYPDIKIIIVFVAQELPHYLDKYKEYLHTVKIPSTLLPAFVAQNARLYWPGLLNYADDEGILITDIDMLPAAGLNFTKYCEEFSSDSFHHFLNSGVGRGEYVMCYNLASSKIWRQVFRVTTEDEAWARMQETSKQYDGKHGGKGWNIDQLQLRQKVDQWAKTSSLNIIKYEIRRLIPKCNLSDTLKLLDEKYTDCHLYADGSQYSLQNILSCLE